jgi:hypothetical protein
LLNAAVAESKDYELDSSGQPLVGCWEITTSTRTYYLQCESDKQMRDWISTIQQHIANKVWAATLHDCGGGGGGGGDC